MTIELNRQLGERMPKIVVSSWPVISPSGNPLASRFLGAIKALQYYERWREGAEQLLTMWLSDAPASVETQIRNQMLRQGFEMWSRAGREILAMYALEGDPLRALSKLSPPVDVLHVYCQPRAPEFLSVQESFAREHPWYSVHRLEGVSQFPTLLGEPTEEESPPTPLSGPPDAATAERLAAVANKHGIEILPSPSEH